MVKNLPATWETWVRSLGWEDPLEKGMATHSNILAWKIPQRNLAGCSPWGRKELDRAEQLTHTHSLERLQLELARLPQRTTATATSAGRCGLSSPNFTPDPNLTLLLDFFLNNIYLLFMYLTAPGLHCSMWGLLVAACRTQFPDQGSNPALLHQKLRVLATGPSGKRNEKPL